MPIDPSKVAKETTQEIPDNETLKEISALAERQVLLADELSRLDEIIKKRAAEYREVSEVLLPEAMTDAGLTKITLENGKTIEIKNNIYASITQANKPDAYKWLRENGHGSLIKERVVQESVHGGTLKAFVREQLSKGKPLPLKLFGVHEVTVAVIK